MNDYLQQFIYNDNAHDVCGACERCVWYVRTMHVVVKQSNVIVCGPINSAVLLRTEALSSVIVDECQSRMSVNVGGGMAGALFGCQHPPACTEQQDRTGGCRHQR